jgi:hypothetical protein
MLSADAPEPDARESSGAQLSASSLAGVYALLGSCEQLGEAVSLFWDRERPALILVDYALSSLPHCWFVRNPEAYRAFVGVALTREGRDMPARVPVTGANGIPILQNRCLRDLRRALAYWLPKNIFSASSPCRQYADVCFNARQYDRDRLQVS